VNKLVFVLAIQVGVVFALASSCSITHKSGDFACTKTSECDTGRDCVDGFCVVSGTEQIDSPAGTDGHGSGSGSGSNGCPAQCTSCSVSQKTCVIDCQGGADCSGAVACPPGYSCDVKCDTDNACRSGVQCAGTTKCTVECSGKNACQNVQCGTSACDVECTGTMSCKTVTCGASCACDVKCIGTQSCGDTVTCTSAACHIGLGCSSLPTTCHSCM
jgi:hypothetical protein